MYDGDEGLYDGRYEGLYEVANMQLVQVNVELTFLTTPIKSKFTASSKTRQKISEHDWHLCVGKAEQSMHDTFTIASSSPSLRRTQSLYVNIPPARQT
jgi:hypothetical protein